MAKSANETTLGDIMNNKFIAITSLAAIFCSGLSGCDSVDATTQDVSSGDLEAAVAALPVEVVVPYVGDIFAIYHTTAVINSDAEAPVLAKVEGEVVEILVEEGDRVKVGQVLARLDGKRLRLQMVQAKAALDKVRNEYDRFVNLQEKGLVSAASVEGLRFDTDALSASYELKRLNYGYTNIRAPIAGIVSARDVKIGQHVAVSDPTFKVTDTSRLVAYLSIPQNELSKFSAGHRATIQVDAMPERRFSATIARISPTVDAKTGTFRATAYLDNDTNDLAPGMFGRFNIAYEKHADVLIIPSAALIREDNETVVYIVTDGAAERRSVVTGIESNGRVEIIAGLQENEKIVVTGLGGLRDGSKVYASIPSGKPVTG